MGYIPFVVEAYPDELLYSWIFRLCDLNRINIRMFNKLYMDKDGRFSGELPIEVRHEFVYLCNSIFSDFNYSRFYYDHSTFPFDMLFTLRKSAIRYANMISFHEDKINVVLFSNLNKAHVCPECIKEDIEKYGKPYLHVRHHIGDSLFCNKHKVPLMEYTGRRSHECEYNMADYVPVQIPDDKQDIELKYAKFVDDIYKYKIHGVLEDLKNAVIQKINEKGYSLYGEGFDEFNKRFAGSEYSRLTNKELRYSLDNYLVKKKNYSCRDLVPLLMFLFENAKELSKYINKQEPLLVDVFCNKCSDKYMSVYDTRYSMNLCPDCYANIPLENKFNNIVKLSKNGKYKAVSEFTSMNTRVDFKHSCGLVTSFLPRNFIFGQSVCPCERKDDETWNKNFELLLQYKEENGNTNVPKRLMYKNVKLGSWCQLIRKEKSKGRLSEDRELKLIDIGFDFEPNTTVWENGFAMYKKYVEKTGEYYIERDIVSEGFKLGLWLNNKRRDYKSGRLTEDKVNAIRSLYPDFPKVPVKEKKPPKITKPNIRFDTAVKLYLEYMGEYGVNIPKSTVYKGYKLGIWANQMRNKFKQGILPQEQINRLNEIGFDWTPLITKWNNDISRYKRYVDTTSKTEVPRDTVFEDSPLGNWYANLKISRKNGSLSSKQINDILKINPKFI